MSSKRLMAIAAAVLAVTASSAHADAATVNDPFYAYTGATPLKSIPPGTVLKSRTVTYHLAGIPTALTAQQLLYRTSNAQNQPVVNVTSVIRSPASNGQAISYQSAYDSLNPYDEPSQVIAGDRDVTKVINVGTLLYSAESIPLSTLLLLGYNVIVPDTEGQTADFAAGPEYGMTTLDSIRAALNTPSTGLAPSSKVAMIGYSGGAIATNWAAQLAPTYAPDVNRQLVGAAEGGVLVDPAHNLHYVDGSIVWGGVAAAALAGLSRGFGFDLTPYLSDKGVAVFNDIQSQSLAYILPKYTGLRWTTLFKPQYASDINSIPAYVTYANKVNAGLAASPTIPMFIGQGTAGVLDGTFSGQVGDGVMLAYDVRALAQKFCASGVPVVYTEYPLEHAGAIAPWVAGMLPWLYDRFAGKAAPSNCALTALLPSNSLAPETLH
ncbi:TPA: triacylglycerol lipase [Burkholderia territorii]|uniref:lipase family protein n=1 Tax=Burkholderia territorii TaxID=1503055 RepID=UPI0011C96C06|nr:lipase family protein [Burkholderia territorii]TXG13738.1 triacylglycerol lipase [Burkholderia territorii]HDR8858520.1 triacylglycerol lipase [Burkholderia territorii]HDR8864565.1 triacylglycerol lipase [Burkholderia territorii]HDR8869593.1 triacylglycerol lipase [Burkholderia territorii]HDR8876532.1 triacylglycerol lipase [Burkholderia territorii]